MSITTTTVFNPKWVQFKRKRVVPKFTWRKGHPAGNPIDLGFTAARGTWIDAEISGWISDIDPQDYGDMREWCEQNLKHSDWCTGVYYIILQREEDVAWFLLRWS